MLFSPRRHRIFPFLPVFVLLLCVTARAAWAINRQPKAVSSGSAARLKTALDSILPEKKMKQLEVGVTVVSLDKGDTLLERNGDTLLIPASVNKVFTAFVALKRLKPTATFKTQIYAVGPTKEGKLAGDLYLKGGGDPSLVSERMWMLVNELVRSGIKQITGNLVADSSYYDFEKTPQSRPKYLRDQAYNAPIGALSFNFNTTTIYVKPGETVGEAPVVYTDPENSYIDVVNQASTSGAGGKNSVVVTRTNFVEGDIGDTVLLRGQIPLDGKELRFYRNIVNPALYTLHMFKTFWEQRGLKFAGRTLEGKVPDGARLVLEFESQPVWQIVWGMNKFSNNFVADQLMKKVGAEVWGPPGTLQKGVAALEDVLQEIGISRKDYEIYDGSGLTRNTRVTARQIVRVLRAAYNDFSIAPEFISSLGVAGEDGTLRNRIPSATVQGLLRAKTGTLDGVTALAGYVPSADGEMLAFAILLNDPKMKYGKISGYTDQIVKALSKFSRK
jgi:serine-type D-Ala-D-Ala carboxypeptidase/endopeptidase (penicillin-binding protein 4)